MGVEIIAKLKPVEMQLAGEILDSLALVQQSGRRVANICKDTLEPELEAYINKVAKYNGETSQEELAKPENRDVFLIRMRNLYDFFGFIPQILDSLVASLNLRKRATEALASAYLDGFFEALFGFLDMFKIIKKGKIDPEQAKNLKAQHFAEIETKQIHHAVTNLTGTIRKRVDELRQAAAKYQQRIWDMGTEIGKLEDSIDEWRKAFKEWRDAGREIPAGRIDRCLRQSEQSFQLKIRRRTEQALKIQYDLEVDALEQLESRVSRLGDDTGEALADKWAKLLGPDGEGAEIVAKARQACKEKLEQVSQLMEREIGEAEQLMVNLERELGAEAGQVRPLLAKYIEELKQLQDAVRNSEKYQVTLLDIGKNASSTFSQKIDQMQQIEAERQKLSESASWWDRLWNWLGEVKNYVWETLKQYVFNVIAAICSWVITAVVGIVGFIVSVLMALMRWAASLTENIECWTRTYIGQAYREKGEKLALGYGLPTTYFSCAEQAAMIRDMIDRTDPDNVSGSVTTQSGKETEKSSVRETVQNKARTEHESNKNAVFSLVMNLCRKSLEPDRVDDAVKDVKRVQVSHSQNIHKHVVKLMDTYNGHFADGDRGFFEFAGKMFSDLWGKVDFSWPQIANYLNLLGSHVTLAGRIMSAGLLFSGFGVPLALALFAFCEIFDKIIVALRIAISLLGTVPCANSFAHDLVAILALTYCGTIEENTEVPDPEALWFYEK